MKIGEMIVTAIISSSVISSIIALAFNWFIQKKNYKRDYYKKIIDKRIEAYELLNKAISQMSIQTHLGDKITSGICLNIETYNFFMVSLGEAMLKSIWLKPKTSAKCTELNIFLQNEVENKVNSNLSKKEIDEQYLSFGIEYLEKIRKFREEIMILINSDFKNLYKVNSFFTKEKIDEKYIVYKSNTSKLSYNNKTK